MQPALLLGVYDPADLMMTEVAVAVAARDALWSKRRTMVKC